MAEIVEYSMVVMISFIFAAGSMAVFENFSSFQSRTIAEAALSSLTTLGSDAISTGSSEAVVFLPQSTISCESGTLTLSTDQFKINSTLADGCSFEISVETGKHLVIFQQDGGYLSMAVA